MVFPRAISNYIPPRPRIIFVLGLRPRTKKILGLGAILLDIAGRSAIYIIYIPLIRTFFFHFSSFKKKKQEIIFNREIFVKNKRKFFIIWKYPHFSKKKKEFFLIWTFIQKQEILFFSKKKRILFNLDLIGKYLFKKRRFF